MLSRADIDAAEQDHESAFCAPSEWARVLTAGCGCLSPWSAADAPHFLHALERFATTLAQYDLRLEGVPGHDARRNRLRHYQSPYRLARSDSFNLIVGISQGDSSSGRILE